MKLHKFLFSLLILFLPTQLGKHFWSDWARVLGLRLDYLSPTIYFTDLLILGIIISWGWGKYNLSKKTSPQPSPTRRGGYFSKNTVFPLFVREGRVSSLIFLFFGFSFFLLVNCFFAQNQPAAFYKLVKIVEFFLLGFYVAKNSHVILHTKYLILIPVIYSSLLAIAQFLKQGSLGGIFYWLGERSFTSGTPGIAQTVWNGQLLLRPYATFPHPNVLAGFLVISLLLILIKNRQINTAVVFCPLVLGVVALFLTFSHVAWVVFVSGILVMSLCRHCERRKQVASASCEPEGCGNLVFTRLLRRFAPRNDVFKFILILEILVFIISVGFYFVPIQSESITYRLDLNLAAIKMWQSSSLMGVGLNNFLVRLPEFYQSYGEIRWFQPAHNLFLMVLAETGAMGLIGLIWFLILTYKRLLKTRFLTKSLLRLSPNCSIAKLLIPLTAILVLGLFDHYFYTLQQGQLLMALVFGLAWSKSLQNGKM